MKKVKVFAPATVANVCCGFDVLGFCLETPGDEVVVSLAGPPGVVIKKISGDNAMLSMDPGKNTVGVSIQSYLKKLNLNHGVEIELVKNLPLGSGMGSSAASAVAAVTGINYLLGEPLSRKELIPFVMEAEGMACGSAHADNAAPCLLGGFTLIRDYHPLDVINVPVKAELYCTLVHPQMELKTSDSRKVLRGSVALREVVTQSGNIAGLMVGLMQPDYELISRSLRDVIAEPIRSVFIPGFEEIRKKVMDVGSLGFGISGSGPTVFTLSRSREIAEFAGVAAKDHFEKMGLPSSYFISAINKEGARVHEIL